MRKSIIAGAAALALCGAASVAMATEAAAAPPTYTCTQTVSFDGSPPFIVTISNVEPKGRSGFERQGFNCVRD